MAQAAVSESIKLSRIRPPFYKMRKDLGDIEGLKESIRQHGLEENLIIRPVPKDHLGRDMETIIGFRRSVAVTELGWTELIIGEHVKIVKCNDKEAFEMALDENDKRKSLDIMEEARAFQAYTEQFGYGSITQLAARMGKSQQFVSSRISLLGLPDEVTTHVVNGQMSPSHGEELARLPTDKATLISDYIIRDGLNAEQTRKVVNLVKHDWEPEHAVQRILEHPEFVADVKEGKPYDPNEAAREGIALALGKALHDVDFQINQLPEGEERAQWIHNVRYPLHGLQDAVIKLRKEYKA